MSTQPAQIVEEVPATMARPWHTLGPEETAQALQTDLEGLSQEEAARRLEQYGPNEVESEDAARWWEILLHQFRDPLSYILLIAAVVTLILRDYTDTGVILAVVFLNAVIGFVQEFRAQEAMQALARLSAPRADVIRDGEMQEIRAARSPRAMWWLLPRAAACPPICGSCVCRAWRSTRRL